MAYADGKTENGSVDKPRFVVQWKPTIIGRLRRGFLKLFSAIIYRIESSTVIKYSAKSRWQDYRSPFPDLDIFLDAVPLTASHADLRLILQAIMDQTIRHGGMTIARFDVLMVLVRRIQIKMHIDMTSDCVDYVLQHG